MNSRTDICFAWFFKLQKISCNLDSKFLSPFFKIKMRKRREVAAFVDAGWFFSGR